MVTAIVSFICGCFFGLLIMALAAASGRSDDREEGDKRNGRLHDDTDRD